jgi:hypothetical protein
MIVMRIAIRPSLNTSSLSLDMVYPGRPGDGGPAVPERPVAWLLSGLRVCPGAGLTVTGQARWGTGVWMSAARGAGAGRDGPVMRAAASTAAPANAAAQIQLIWAKLDRNWAGSV